MKPAKAVFFDLDATLVYLDGAVLEDKTYDKPGGYTLTTKPVSGGTVTISVDKTFSTAGDQRQLGMIVSELGFR